MNLDPAACISNPGRLVVGPTQAGMNGAGYGTAPTGALSPITAAFNTAPVPTAGVHWVAYSWVYAGGESALSPAASVTTSGTNVIATNGYDSPPAGATAAKLYMTTAGGSSAGPFYYVTRCSLTGAGAIVSGTFSAPITTAPFLRSPDSDLVTPVPGNLGIYPYGSTQPIGFVRAAKLIRTQAIVGLNSESRGRDGVSWYAGKHGAAFVFVLMQNDANAWAKTWATATGSNFGTPISSLPAPGRSVQPGLITPDSPLLFVADNVVYQPSMLILSPAWNNGARLEIAQALNLPYEEVLVVGVGDDASQNDVRVGLLADLSLT